MDESGETVSQDNARRVRVVWFPTYREVRHLLGVWPGRSKTQITKLQSTIMQQTGTPDDPVSWSDPDAWIPERLSGESRKLAYAIWEGSDKTVNPRHTAGSWSLIRHYALLTEDSDGNLQLTDRGHSFIDQAFGSAETFIDQKEGLIDLLGIVGDRGPARTAVLLEPWAEFLLEVESPFRSSSTIRDTLRRRLSNLRDRNLVNREGLDYSITEDGLDYLEGVGAATGTVTPKVPAGIKRYTEDEGGRTILTAFADSIEFAHSLNPEGWATLFDRGRRDMRLYVGSTLMLVLEATRKRVEVTLLSKEPEDEQREWMRSARVLQEYTYPEGAKRYLLSWSDFVEHWESMRTVHQETARQVVMKAPRAAGHRTDAVDFLNGTLRRKLPQPGYVVDGSDPIDPSDGGFKELTKFLQDDGLLFSQELVASYILALQAKRFAILTGISGTGKTKIARAVAQHFEPVVKRRVAKIPDDAVRMEVKPYQTKHSRLLLPVALSNHLTIDTPTDPGKGPRIWVRYPSGRISLSSYLAQGRHPMLYFSGDFRQWFHSNLKEGDQFWLRVLPGEEDEPDETEIGLPETEIEEQRLNNYVVVPVRPDWVDNRGLLGYLNPLTNEYSTTPFLNVLLRARDEEERAEAADEKPHPFFVILDEMNLARVEHYFSDFLSALESGEDIPLHENEAIESGESESGPQVPRQLKVPDNVLFTGTVNVDETTYMFSPKVLDRAFTIEFDQVDLQGFTDGASSEDTSGLNLGSDQGPLDLLPSGRSEDDDWKPRREDWVEFSKKTAGHHKALLRLHGILEEQHRHFGYRVANEIARFVNLAREQAAEADTDPAVDAAFDLALLQKVLPKFHGTQQELESLLEEIFQFAVHGGGHVPKKNQTVELHDWKVVNGRLVTRSKAQAPSQTPSGDAGTESPAYPRTGAKVLRMLNRLRDRGFTSFIE